MSDNTRNATAEFIAYENFQFIAGTDLVNVNTLDKATVRATSGIPSGGLTTTGVEGIVDGFGLFSHTFQATTGTTWIKINLLLTKATGTWATAADVLGPNALGYLVAARIGVCADIFCTAFSHQGLAANSITVPEPSTYLILGTMLTVIFLLKRHKDFKRV
jgi:hypothetical protein